MSRSVGNTDLEASEIVTLYPSYGHWDAKSQTWHVTVAGVILEPGLVSLGKRLLLKLFRRILGGKLEPEESELFQQRIRDFAAGTQRGKRVVIKVGSHKFELPKKTKRNGHFAGVLKLSPEELRSLENEGHLRDGWLAYQVVTQAHDERAFHGRAILVRGPGISVISDIDDTIKVTEVSDQDSLLANTFLRRFRSIEGMSDLYRKWESAGATFHYVSSSPWQLYRPLAELCESEAFPAGTFHLRAFRLRDQLLTKIFRIRRSAKLTAMKAILKAFPERRFILVGDSGERDPEIYGKLARKFPAQVVAILIRQIPDNRVDIARCMKAFRKIPSNLWHLFESPELLHESFPINEQGKLSGHFHGPGNN